MMTLFRNLRRDRNGVAIHEFGLLAPVLIVMLLGFFDIGHNMYANTMLYGSVQKAARDSALEGASDTTIDAKVTQAVRDVVGDADLTFERTAYSSFTAVSKAEEFTDLNGDGSCNDGEPFEDANANAVWDRDQGEAGMGGARDAIVYNVTIKYPRQFPIAPLIGLATHHETTATTVLRNQPFGDRIDRAVVGNCP